MTEYEKYLYKVVIRRNRLSVKRCQQEIKTCRAEIRRLYKGLRAD